MIPNPRGLKFQEVEEELSFDITSSRMLQHNRLARGEHVGEIFSDGSNTPLRAGLVRLPRLRLLDKHFKLGTVPIYATRKDKSNQMRSFVNRTNKNCGMIEVADCTSDRFIPRRKDHNLEAAYHSLVVKTPKKQCTGRDLDLPNDLNSMGFEWQKKTMARAFKNVMANGQSDKILQLSQRSSFVPTVFGSLAGRPRHLEEDVENLDVYKWPVKPRKRPVIGQPDVILDMPHFRPSIRKHLLDWSSKNMIGAVINHEGRYGVCLVNGDVTLNTDDTQFLFHDRCTALKFSNSGDKIAIGRESAITSVYTINPNKVSLEFQCAATNHPFPCQPHAYDWTKDDRYLLVGCSGGYLAVVAYVQKTSEVKIVQASSSEIIAVSFSPNDKYIACCGRESTVRIFTRPDLTPYMEIGYCFPVRAMAWHPWESSVLCIGGGVGDGGLSMWNVQCYKSLLYRSINFTGSVDTLAWNKVTGELMVNWFVRERDQCYVAMPVYASIDRVTDAIVPTFEKNRILYTAWSPDGSHIACQARESVVIYNFLDDTSEERLARCKRKLERKKKSATGLFYHNLR